MKAIYKLTVQYFHGGTTKKDDWTEIFYYITAESFRDAIDKFEQNLTRKRKNRPQIDEKITRIEFADNRVQII